MENNSSPEQLVCQALQYACSQDINILKQAEQKLSEWGTEPGFHLTLINIFKNQQLDPNVRWMAVVCCKNGVNRYWRRNIKHEIQQSEKAQIRTELMLNLNEPVPQVAIQVADLIARIVRLENSEEWPDLIPVLLEACRSTDSVHQHRALLIFYHVIKALSSKRIFHDRKEFEQLAMNVYSFILNLWDGFTTLFFQSIQENNTQDISINYLEKALLSLRILRKLTISGIRKPHNSQNCMLFLGAIFRRSNELLECRYELKRRQASDTIIELIEKFILKQTKILNEFLEQHPLSFVSHIPQALEFSFNYVFHTGTNMIYENNVISFTNFAIHCINLMKGILSSVAYKKPRTNDGYDDNEMTTMKLLSGLSIATAPAVKESIAENSTNAIATGTTTTISTTTVATEAETTLGSIMQMYSNERTNDSLNYITNNVVHGSEAKMQFFTNERLSYICEKIITHYFLLTQQDLDLWIDDPENFALDEGGESWKYALRPCTETFFATLFNEFRKEMLPEVLKYVRKAQEINLTPDSDLKDILLKDAIYTAIGLVSFHFYDEIDFSTWFTDQLLNELKIKTDNFRIIRRKVIWLIGHWIRVKFRKSLRPKVYEICLELLQSQEDMCVRLASSKTLMNAINDFDFQSEPFIPYLEPLFSALFTLLKEALECETKMNVLCIMSFIVNKMSDYIHPHTNNLITYLPYLWKDSEDHNMLRCAIISTLLQIVKAISDVPSTLLQFIYPVIDISTDISNSSSVYLMEEGLELWLTVLHNTSALTQELLNLCKNLLPIIENSSENLRTVLYIIEAYVVLSPDVYLQHHGKNVISTCAYLMTDMRQDGIVVVVKLFETFLIAESNLGIELIKPVLPYIFKQICTEKEYPIATIRYLSLAARALIINQQIFIEALQESNQSNSFETILDMWLSNMSCTLNIEEKKLTSIALGSILTADNTVIYDKFPTIVQIICETLNDVMKEDRNGGLNDCLIFEEGVYYEIFGDFDYSTYHYERVRKLSYKDHVHRIVLKNYIESQLSTLKQNLGDQRYETLMYTVDREILLNLSEYMHIFLKIPDPINE